MVVIIQIIHNYYIYNLLQLHVKRVTIYMYITVCVVT